MSDNQESYQYSSLSNIERLDSNEPMYKKKSHYQLLPYGNQTEGQWISKLLHSFQQGNDDSKTFNTQTSQPQQNQYFEQNDQVFNGQSVSDMKPEDYFSNDDDNNNKNNLLEYEESNEFDFHSQLFPNIETNKNQIPVYPPKDGKTTRIYRSEGNGHGSEDINQCNSPFLKMIQKILNNNWYFSLFKKDSIDAIKKIFVGDSEEFQKRREIIYKYITTPENYYELYKFDEQNCDNCRKIFEKNIQIVSKNEDLYQWCYEKALVRIIEIFRQNIIKDEDFKQRSPQFCQFRNKPPVVENPYTIRCVISQKTGGGSYHLIEDLKTLELLKYHGKQYEPFILEQMRRNNIMTKEEKKEEKLQKQEQQQGKRKGEKEQQDNNDSQYLQKKIKPNQ